MVMLRTMCVPSSSVRTGLIDKAAMAQRAPTFLPVACSALAVLR